eukprot:141771_1
MSQAVSSEIPYLLPAASIAYIHYLRNGNKSDACSVAICGYLLSSCFDSAIESNKEHISGFKPPANPRLQVVIASTCSSSSLAILLHVFKVNKQRNNSCNGPIICSFCVGATLLRYLTNAFTNGQRSVFPNKSPIPWDSGLVSAAAIGAGIGVFVAHKYNKKACQ